ncbi:N-acetylmuramoyl-L-alanine amidase, partial [Clostridium sporogenes]|uniref:CBO1751 family endolysin n=1 Tax=Clostridium sporogenes TaxID=1509 RepID=UPI002237EBC6
MKIGVDCGHTLSGADYGAVGIKAESNLTREVGIRVISKLQALGHTVIKCYKDTCSSLNDSLSYRTNTANSNGVDLYVSIHFNCYNGNAYGTEVFTYGGKSFTEASRVLNNICALGYTNRGIKDGSNLYVLKHTKAKAMLIECCFCD